MTIINCADGKAIVVGELPGRRQRADNAILYPGDKVRVSPFNVQRLRYAGDTGALTGQYVQRPQGMKVKIQRDGGGRPVEVLATDLVPESTPPYNEFRYKRG